MSSNTNLNTKRIFLAITKKLDFQGGGATRHLEMQTYWIIANYQKSSYSSDFYINIGILYKELLATQPSSNDIATCFKSKSPFWPHVTFRIEECPELPRSLAANLKNTTAMINTNDETQIHDALLAALTKTIAFIERNHSRETMRKLHLEKRLNAMILKEV